VLVPRPKRCPELSLPFGAPLVHSENNIPRNMGVKVLTTVMLTPLQRSVLPFRGAKGSDAGSSLTVRGLAGMRLDIRETREDTIDIRLREARDAFECALETSSI